MEPGVQTPRETLERKAGSCRDSAWLLVQILRRLHLAARFASGYLIQLTADQKSLDGPSGPENDFTDLHAWAEVYLPGAGWIGLDPTSGLLCGEGHLPVACTPDPSSAAPVTGLVEMSKCEFDFHMSVQRIEEDPRTTKPYTDDQWRRIDTLGKKVDQQLVQDDVRLTFGGEPTFVSMDDMEGPEWTTDAVGPTKRLLSGHLVKRLRDRFAPGAFLHYGQGKWYPGESLPRWALTCMWRLDGEPIWQDAKWIADEKKDYGFTFKHARRFSEALSDNLGVDSKWLVPAYEDVHYYLWREQRLPLNVKPWDPKLEILRNGLAWLASLAEELTSLWESCYRFSVSGGNHGQNGEAGPGRFVRRSCFCYLVILRLVCDCLSTRFRILSPNRAVSDAIRSILATAAVVSCGIDCSAESTAK